MDDGQVDLRAAFGLDDESMEAIRNGVRKSEAVIAVARGAVSGSAPALLEGVVGQVQGRVEEILQIPLSRILAGAWHSYAPFLQYCDTEAYPPGDVEEVELESHTVRASLKPYIEISVDGKRVGRIDFELEVEVRLDAAILVVQNARFMELRTGRSTFAGTLSLEGSRLAHTEKPCPLPGKISFGQGIPIRPFTGEPADAIALQAGGQN